MAAACLVLSVAAAAADPTVFIFPPVLVIDPGEIATLEVRVDDSGDSISCFIVQIHFDPSVFAVLDVQEGNLYRTSPHPTFPDWALIAPDTLQASNCVLGSGTFVLGPGALADIEIQGVDIGVSPAELAFAQVRDIDRIPYGNPAVIDGEVRVGVPAGLPEDGGTPAHSAPRLEVWPNPASGRARIVLLGAGGTEGAAADPRRAAPHQLEIYDVGGRRCRTLDGFGRHGADIWDGRDDNGRPLPAGIYLVRARGLELSAKLVLER